MFKVVEDWARSYRGPRLDDVLSSDSVRAGKNHSGQNDHSHGAGHGAADLSAFQSHGGGHGHGAQSSEHAPSHQSGGHQSGGGPGGLLGSIAGNLPGGLGSKLSPTLNLFSQKREGPGEFDDGRPSSSSGDPYRSHSPAPYDWGSFQPYEFQYAGGGYQQQGAPEYNAPPSQNAWVGGGEYSGGHGVEPAYTVPTAYQQGYENYGASSGPGGYGGGGYGGGGYQQQPPQQHGGYSYDQGSGGGDGRRWGE